MELNNNGGGGGGGSSKGSGATRHMVGGRTQGMEGFNMTNSESSSIFLLLALLEFNTIWPFLLKHYIYK